LARAGKAIKASMRLNFAGYLMQNIKRELTAPVGMQFPFESQGTAQF